MSSYIPIRKGILKAVGKCGVYKGKLQAAILDWSGTTADAHVIAPAVVFKNVRASYFDDPHRVEQGKKYTDQITKDFHHYAEKWSTLNESFIKTNQDLQAKYD